MARIGCIFVADFPIAAIVRANPALADAVLVLAESSAAHAEITGVSAKARGLGIRAGMTLAQARAISSAMVVSAPSSAAESSAHQALADAAESVSPVVEPGAPGCVWFDQAGLERIFPGEDDLAAELQRRVLRLGMHAAVGIGASRAVAAMAARCGGIRVIAAGRDREFLDWLPIETLKLETDLESTLFRWGIRRLGDLARLAPEAIGSRLGRRGVDLARLAHGGGSRPLTVRRRAEIFAEIAEPGYAIDNLEPLGFVLRGLVERIAARLEMRGLAAAEAMLVLGLEDHRVASRRVPITAPTCDVRAILTLINLALEAAPPEAAVETIRIEVTPRAARPAQADMFLPPAPAPDRLATTIARLAALCGPGNVGTLRAENSHRPEAVRVTPFDPPPPRPKQDPAGGHPAVQLVIRALKPAIEIEVMTSRGELKFVRGPNLGARVVTMAGPWRRDGEWWKSTSSDSLRPDAADRCAAVPSDRVPVIRPEDRPGSPTAHMHAVGLCNGSGGGFGGGFTRDYYELALDDGGVYRVFCDLGSNRWFLDGVYD